MPRAAGRPDPQKASGNVKFAKLFGSLFNLMVVVAFVLGLLCSAMPGLHIKLLLPCMLLWLAIALVWILRAFRVKKLLVWCWTRLNWGFAPMMLLVLSILWAAHIPLSINFALHKSGFERLADLAMAEPSGKIDFTPNQPMGLFSISGAFRLSPTIASIETTSEDSLWAHEGFVRDLSRKPGGLKANTYSLAPYSNNGDQDIFYLSDGWYVFQNLFD
ncbi:MAG TPA: hypothetical protein V6C85_30540 [Allocoleopsis sp.]